MVKNKAEEFFQYLVRKNQSALKAPTKKKKEMKKKGGKKQGVMKGGGMGKTKKTSSKKKKSSQRGGKKSTAHQKGGRKKKKGVTAPYTRQQQVPEAERTTASQALSNATKAGLIPTSKLGYYLGGIKVN